MSVLSTFIISIIIFLYSYSTLLRNNVLFIEVLHVLNEHSPPHHHHRYYHHPTTTTTTTTTPPPDVRTTVRRREPRPRSADQ